MELIDDIPVFGQADDRTLNQIRDARAPPNVDYEVARLFEDVQEQRPYALEPVPEDLAAMASDPEWYNRSREWQEMQSDDAGELWFDGFEWWHARQMDSVYLRHGLIFTTWRLENEVHFRWSYSGREQVWCVPNGEIRVSVDHFSRAVDSFLDAVLAAMQKRVDEIGRMRWLRTDCSVNVEQLVAEQALRIKTLEQFKVRSPNTDWTSARVLFEVLREKVDEERGKT
ncbi:MAG TPA: DUF5984 family protein [Terracidiphilus sp.]